jgi:phenylacetic acid degradation operon negative regulatory protein
VALSRLAADGDVVADEGVYRLSARHLDRQRDQDVALRPPTRPWRGGWHMAVMLAGAEGRPPSTGPEARLVLDRWRMAELRPGVWTRPDNLVAPDTAGAADMLVWTGRPAGGTPTAEALAQRLWDLAGWAQRAGSLVDELSAAEEPAVRLSVAAAMVRHIRSDPVLPARLLPPRWPGPRLRRAYDGYRAELGRVIAALRDD